MSQNVYIGMTLKPWPILLDHYNNGKSVIVKINDRGPFVRGRIIDLSKSAFSSIGNTSSGLIDVKIEVIK